MKQDDVTIVVVPRDHFSDAKESLESIFALTPSCPLVYVDGGSPPRVARFIREQARAKGFELLRYDYYLTPNQARNIGAARVRSRYVVFIDNDVIVAPDWLPPLVECADATGAAVVGPLNFENRPLHQEVHFAGGNARIISTNDNGRERHRLVDRIHKVRVPSSPEPTEAAEFHCMLVRTDVFRRLGGLDETCSARARTSIFVLRFRIAARRSTSTRGPGSPICLPSRSGCPMYPTSRCAGATRGTCRVSTTFETSGSSTRTSTFSANTKTSAGGGVG